MRMLKFFILLAGVLFCHAATAQKPQPAPFSYDTSGFYLNGQPFVMWGGEMHFQRIPRAYWRDRLLKAKAMGLNTVGTYVFWNALEPPSGQVGLFRKQRSGRVYRNGAGSGTVRLSAPGTLRVRGVGFWWSAGMAAGQTRR